MDDRQLIAQIHALRQMSVGELKEEWRRLFGEEPRSRNKQYLFRRLAWRVQELALGGLSARARARIEELAKDAPLRVRPPAGWEPADGAEKLKTRRDPRLPQPGAVLTKTYRGEQLRVTVLEEGFEWKGQTYTSLSALAHAITGQKWNGPLFFGLRNRKRKKV